jgi:hypothetical protein
VFDAFDFIVIQARHVDMKVDPVERRAGDALLIARDHRWNSVDTIARIFGEAASDLITLLPDLATILPTITPAPSLDPEQLQQRLFRAMAHVLTSLSTHNSIPAPVVLVLEKLHCCDETTLAFLHMFVRRIAGYPLLVVLTYRYLSDVSVCGADTLDACRRDFDEALQLARAVVNDHWRWPSGYAAQVLLIFLRHLALLFACKQAVPYIAGRHGGLTCLPYIRTGTVRSARAPTLSLVKLRHHLYDRRDGSLRLVKLNVVAALVGKHLLAMR